MTLSTTLQTTRLWLRGVCRRTFRRTPPLRLDGCYILRRISEGIAWEDAVKERGAQNAAYEAAWMRGENPVDPTPTWLRRQCITLADYDVPHEDILRYHTEEMVAHQDRLVKPARALAHHT